MVSVKHKAIRKLLAECGGQRWAAFSGDCRWCGLGAAFGRGRRGLSRNPICRRPRALSIHSIEIHKPALNKALRHGFERGVPYGGF